MARIPLLCLVSCCFVLSFGTLVHAQHYQINNGFAGVKPGTGYGYQEQRTDPRLGYCLRNDCFVGQGPYAHMAVINGGGSGGCGGGGLGGSGGLGFGGYGNGGYGQGYGGYGGQGGYGNGNDGSTRIRITIYPEGSGTPPVIQSNCPYCNVRINQGVYTTTSAGRAATRAPVNTVQQPTAAGTNRSYKYKF